jgi:acyl-coenzyme A thioesterase 9
MTSVIPVRGFIPWAQVLLDASSTANASSKESLILRSAPEALTPRSMHDSYTEIYLPFASSPELFEQYTNATGGIRTGKLLEHLDSLAGSISYKHMLGPHAETLGKIKEQGFYIVTASADRFVSLNKHLKRFENCLAG